MTDIYSIQEVDAQKFNLDESAYHYAIDFTYERDNYVIDMPTISHSVIWGKLKKYSQKLSQILTINNVYVMGPLLCQIIHTENITYNIVDLFIVSQQPEIEFSQVITLFADAAIYYNDICVICQTKTHTFNIYKQNYATVRDLLYSVSIDNFAIATNKGNTFAHKNALISHLFRITPLLKHNCATINDLIFLTNAGFTPTVVCVDKTVQLFNYFPPFCMEITGQTTINMDINQFRVKNLYGKNIKINFQYFSHGIGANIFGIIYNSSMLIPPKSPRKLYKNNTKFGPDDCISCGFAEMEANYYEYPEGKICIACLEVKGNTGRYFHRCNFNGKLRILCGHEQKMNKNITTFKSYFTDSTLVCACGLELNTQ